MADHPRQHDRLILVGMNDRTRGRIPWDADAEFWVLNEMPSQPWVKRFDRLFQLHPRWDFSRLDNVTDPNHLYWLQNVPGTCRKCKGTGMYGEQLCTECVGGNYTPLANREGKLIYMQEEHPDIAGSVKYPFEEVSKFCPEEPYFTSTFSYMLSLGLLLGFPEIEIYGFGMESETEYAHQRVCAEYWMGFGRGRGIKITAPGADLMRGDLYAYRDMQQGFKQYMEGRKRNLAKQLQDANNKLLLSEGALTALLPLKEQHPEIWDAAFNQHVQNKFLRDFIMGAIKEVEHVERIFDAYHVEFSTPQEMPFMAELIGMTYKV